MAPYVHTVGRNRQGRFLSKESEKRIDRYKKVRNGREEDIQNQTDTIQSGWKDGRRVVELDFLAQQLDACKNCYKSLHLVDCVRERLIHDMTKITIFIY